MTSLQFILVLLLFGSNFALNLLSTIFRPRSLTHHPYSNIPVKERPYLAPPRRGVPTPRSTTVRTAEELRTKVLDEGARLKDVQVDLQPSNVTNADLLDHQVLELIAARFANHSKPGARSDPHVLALSLEGGGMRGAVSAGMAAAIASLGLTDSFDRIYGSSAGSVIGAYIVSRQMCMDVYVDILPAAKKSFVCVQRLVSALAATAADLILSQVKTYPRLRHRASPGMNISFVLDGIMHDEHGIRPLDLDAFTQNDARQPLRVATSYVKNGRLGTKCFGAQDFATVRRADGHRKGLYACLEAGMTVPGATGPPVPIVEGEETISCFDAFCCEPLPYRSAVEEGATHCLVLCSRPEGFKPKTKPGIYERAVAPLYFRSHGEPDVAKFFEKGGQQYIYAEDLLTLEEGKNSRSGVSVPPPRVLHGVDRDLETLYVSRQRKHWKKAHVLPLKCPQGVPELSTLQQERDEVSDAVREGFAAAFDLLSPVIGLTLEEGLTGTDVASFVFPPDTKLDESVLQKQLKVDGDFISSRLDLEVISEPSRRPRRRRKRDIMLRVFGLRRKRKAEAKISLVAAWQKQSEDHAEKLLHILPGFQSGQLKHLSTSLRGAKQF